MKVVLILNLLFTVSHVLVDDSMEGCFGKIKSRISFRLLTRFKVMSPIGNTIVTVGEKMKIQWYECFF